VINFNLKTALLKMFDGPFFSFVKDDCLSALDAHVGGDVFNNAIKKLLLETYGKTVVLVTHHIHLLPHADHVSIKMSSSRWLFMLLLKNVSKVMRFSVHS
jgi:ABC-type lipoprotein export system ATPase subunit